MFEPPLFPKSDSTRVKFGKFDEQYPAILWNFIYTQMYYLSSITCTNDPLFQRKWDWVGEVGIGKGGLEKGIEKGMGRLGEEIGKGVLKACASKK